MKSVKILLLCACLLLCGCAAEPPENPDLPPETEKVFQSETPAPTETEEKTTPAPQTATETAAAESEAPPPPIPEEAKRAVPPTLLTETIELKPLAEPITCEEIKALFGYDVELTGQDAEFHQEEIDHVEKAASEGEISSERLEKYREQNYMRMNVGACWLGLPEADWLCTADYMLDYCGIQGSRLTRAAFVKDGKLVKEIDPGGGWSSGIYYSEGELFLAMHGGLYRYDFETEQTVTVMEDSWAGISYLDRDYLIYGNGDQRILIRATGEIVDSGIDWLYYQSPNTFRVLDGEIRYIEHMTGRSCVYDMNERTVTEDPSFDFDAPFYQGLPDDEYELSFFKMSGDSEKYEGLKAVHKESGEETFYDLSGVYTPTAYLLQWDCPLDGEWFWLDGDKALNLRTGALARLPEGEEIYYTDQHFSRSGYDGYAPVIPIYPDDPKTE